MDEKTPIVSGRSSSDTEDSQAIYHGEGQSRSQKVGQIICMIIVVLASLVCLGLCIRGGILKQSTHIAFLYFMFALTVAGVAAVHIIMLIFMKKNYISEEKIWFAYVSGFFVVVQSVFIDIIVLSKGL